MLQKDQNNDIKHIIYQVKKEEKTDKKYFQAYLVLEKRKRIKSLTKKLNKIEEKKELKPIYRR